MDAKQAASQRASEKSGKPESQEAGEQVERRNTRPAIPGMTTYEDLMERYKTNIVKTPSGLTFLIQTVNPGDFLAAAGTPLLKYWIEQGVDITDDEARAKAFEQMPDEKKLDLGMDNSFRDMVRDVVCAGIYSVKFVNKPQPECDSGKEELSVNLLPISDLVEIFKEIMALSKGEEFLPELELFRKASEDGAGEAMADTDPRPGESIQPAPQPDIVPENPEP